MTEKGYVVLIILFINLLSGAATAQEDRTNLELIKSINELSISGDIYSDVNNIRSLAVLFLSGKEGINSDYNKFAESIKKFLQEFNTIFQKSKNCQPAICEDGVKKAIQLRNEIVYLEELSKSSKNLEPLKMDEIIDKEKKSINRFLEDQAKYFEEIIQKEEAVPLKIEYMEYEKMAYCDAGSSACELITKTKEKTESDFNNQISQASDFSNNADEMIREIKNDDNGLSYQLLSYTRSKHAINNYFNAIELYHNNGISVKTLEKLPEKYVKSYNELINRNRIAEEISYSILRNLMISLVRILIPLFIAMIIFIYGFNNWKKDFADSKLTKIIRKE